jgi:hypothetical protein
MNRVLRVLLLLLWLVMGYVLILVPWSSLWESNFFLNRYPALIPILLNPYLRGAISGLGLIDAFLAADAFRRRSSAVATRT